MIALTGVRPTGELHLGNYFGALKQLISLQRDYDIYFFVADLHALTTCVCQENLSEVSESLVASVIAVGLDPQKNLIWTQSSVPEVCELMYLLSCLTGFQYLNKGHAFKTAKETHKNPNVGLFLYPVLMAADIILYQSDVVPVGKDQQQHIEICRDLSEKLVKLIGSWVKIPQALILDELAVIPGTDGRKMSKSYGNTVPIFAEKDRILKIFKKISTDSTKLGNPIDLHNSVLGSYLKLMMEPEGYQSLVSACLEGKYGWGQVKEIAFEVFLKYFEPARTKFLDLMRDRATIKDIISSGNEKARAIGADFMRKFKKALGIISYV
ncbi:MAG: tryptophan--tRNA ligase [Deltaproteobacteria bacterium]|nr:tryptophan--tRNA ligase [Deltaproteobacteria bacterium]